MPLLLDLALQLDFKLSQALLHLLVQLSTLLLVLVVLEVRFEEPDLVVNVPGLLEEAVVLQLDLLLLEL